MKKVEQFCDGTGIEEMKGLCYLDDWINASGGSEAASTARAKVVWIKFWKCGEIFYGKRFSLKMKGKIHTTCVRSAMLSGSETVPGPY